MSGNPQKPDLPASTAAGTGGDATRDAVNTLAAPPPTATDPGVPGEPTKVPPENVNGASPVAGSKATLGPRNKSRVSGLKGGESEVSTAAKKVSTGSKVCKRISHFLSRVFAFPLVSEPICFHRAGMEPLDEEEEAKARRSRKKVEEMVNFDSKATKILYNQILERRKEVLASKNKYHYADIDLTQYPGWDEATINRLKAMFQIFDISEDGLIDFEETCTVLTEFGDKTALDIRKKIFLRVHNDEFGSIGFDEFIEIVYNLTMKAVDPSEKPLSDIFKKIENNVNIRSKLDVLGQLQGGLF